jgi:hypothetical protein
VGALQVGHGVPRSALRLRRDGLRSGAPELSGLPGVHETLHWGYEDPAAAAGTDEERLAVFRRVFIGLGERVQQFIPLARKASTLDPT